MLRVLVLCATALAQPAARTLQATFASGGGSSLQSELRVDGQAWVAMAADTGVFAAGRWRNQVRRAFDGDGESKQSRKRLSLTFPSISRALGRCGCCRP